MLPALPEPDPPLPVDISVVSAQDEPSHSSTFAFADGPPPICKAAVCIPAPAPYLAVPKSATSVQLDPSYDSVTAWGGSPYPPKPNAAVDVPHPAGP